MTYILVINAGSSSLKYQLIDIDEKQIIAKGICERIGIAKSVLSYKPTNGECFEKESKSGGSGACNSTRAPPAGCVNCSRHACRNMRLRPCFCNALLRSKSPYLSSPAMG